MFTKLFLFLYISHVSYCDWAEDWMSPIKAQFRKQSSGHRHNNRRMFNENELRELLNPEDSDSNTSPPVETRRAETPQSSMKAKLEDTVTNAEELLQKIKLQIQKIHLKEKILKEAIANGRSGVTAVTVSSIAHTPRSYLIRDGVWSMCSGLVQYPSMVQPQPTSLFQEIFSTPRCIGHEMVTMKDPCAFNSMIKYETLPTRRRMDYQEENIFCLKTAFNNTLEQYLSVPKSVVNETCKDGSIRSYNDNIKQCGIRVLSEYTFYPHRSSAASLLPLEYCSEKDGSCKMIIAWHVSNSSVENFEFLKNEKSFKKYFIQPAPYIEQAM